MVYDRSSECSPETFGMWKSDRLIEITKQQGFSNYVNVIWGEEIHKKDYFSAQGVNLEYLSSLDRITSYNVCYTKLLRNPGTMYDFAFNSSSTAPNQRDIGSRSNMFLI